MDEDNEMVVDFWGVRSLVQLIGEQLALGCFRHVPAFSEVTFNSWRTKDSRFEKTELFDHTVKNLILKRPNFILRDSAKIIACVGQIRNTIGRKNVSIWRTENC